MKAFAPIACVVATGWAGLPSVDARADDRGGVVEAAVRLDRPGPIVSRHVYGHFAEHLGRCIDGGLWVGEDSPIPNTGGVRDDVLAALRAIGPPNLRWPGGCFADDYHWRDGIGPRDARPRTVNLHWGRAIEDNAFGTHEFFDLCERLGAAPYLSANVGSGTARELRDWLEYCTFDGDSTLARQRRANGRDAPWAVPFVGVGNESWGCGGHMLPEHYADRYKRFWTFARPLVGPDVTMVAVGPGGISDFGRNWTRVVCERLGAHMDAISVHYYTRGLRGAQNALPATGFDRREWALVLRDALRIEQAIDETIETLDRYDPSGRIKVFVDEWGAWYRAEPGAAGHELYQQNTIRDALVAAYTLHVFHRHADRVAMANIAQTVNVLQAMILTERGGPRMTLTPTYHVFEMLRGHHDAATAPVDFQAPEHRVGDVAHPALSVAATQRDGLALVSIANGDAERSFTLRLRVVGGAVGAATGRVLTADAIDAHNTFDQPGAVRPVPLEGVSVDGAMVTVPVPARSVLALEIGT